MRVEAEEKGNGTGPTSTIKWQNRQQQSTFLYTAGATSTTTICLQLEQHEV